MEKANLILHWLTYACNDIESDIDSIAHINMLETHHSRKMLLINSFI